MESISEDKVMSITFKSLKDFQERIAGLWQKQDENTIYDFIFPDDETEKEFENLMGCFRNGMD